MDVQPGCSVSGQAERKKTGEIPSSLFLLKRMEPWMQSGNVNKGCGPLSWHPTEGNTIHYRENLKDMVQYLCSFKENMK